MRFCIFLPVCTKGQLSACALCPICLSIVVAKKQMPRIAARYRASLVGVGAFRHRKAVPESLSLLLASFPNRNSRDVEGAVPYDLHRFSIVIRGTSGVSNPFRGERDHREHTAKRWWNACPYNLHRFSLVGVGASTTRRLFIPIRGTSRGRPLPLLRTHRRHGYHPPAEILRSHTMPHCLCCHP